MLRGQMSERLVRKSKNTEACEASWLAANLAATGSSEKPKLPIDRMRTLDHPRQGFLRALQEEDATGIEARRLHYEDFAGKRGEAAASAAMNAGR